VKFWMLRIKQVENMEAEFPFLVRSPGGTDICADVAGDSGEGTFCSIKR